jgi:hypothetical protein
MRIATTRLDVEVEILPLMRIPVPDLKIRLSPKKTDNRVQPGRTPHASTAFLTRRAKPAFPTRTYLKISERRRDKAKTGEKAEFTRKQMSVLSLFLTPLGWAKHSNFEIGSSHRSS